MAAQSSGWSSSDGSLTPLSSRASSPDEEPPSSSSTAFDVVSSSADKGKGPTAPSWVHAAGEKQDGCIKSEEIALELDELQIEPAGQAPPESSSQRKEVGKRAASKSKRTTRTPERFVEREASAPVSRGSSTSATFALSSGNQLAGHRGRSSEPPFAEREARRELREIAALKAPAVVTPRGHAIDVATIPTAGWRGWTVVAVGEDGQSIAATRMEHLQQGTCCDPLYRNLLPCPACKRILEKEAAAKVKVKQEEDEDELGVHGGQDVDEEEHGCSFRHLRHFTYDGLPGAVDLPAEIPLDNVEIKLVAPSDAQRDPEEFVWQTTWSRPIGSRELALLRDVSATHLPPALEKALCHSRLPGCLVVESDAQTRSTCDTCLVIISLSYFVCPACGAELCPDCVHELKPLEHDPFPQEAGASRPVRRAAATAGLGDVEMQAAGAGEEPDAPPPLPRFQLDLDRDLIKGQEKQLPGAFERTARCHLVRDNNGEDQRWTEELFSRGQKEVDEERQRDSAKKDAGEGPRSEDKPTSTSATPEPAATPSSSSSRVTRQKSSAQLSEEEKERLLLRERVKKDQEMASWTKQKPSVLASATAGRKRNQSTASLYSDNESDDRRDEPQKAPPGMRWLLHRRSCFVPVTRIHERRLQGILSGMYEWQRSREDQWSQEASANIAGSSAIFSSGDREANLRQARTTFAVFYEPRPETSDPPEAFSEATLAAAEQRLYATSTALPSEGEGEERLLAMWDGRGLPFATVPVSRFRPQDEAEQEEQKQDEQKQEEQKQEEQKQDASEVGNEPPAADAGLLEPWEVDFHCLWATGQPSVILLDIGWETVVQYYWDVLEFVEMHGSEVISIVHNQTNKKAEAATTVARVFGRWRGGVGLEHLDDLEGDYWKVKDWPDKHHWKDAFEAAYHDYLRLVPLRDFTSLDGVFNLASYAPLNTNPPDLGPKGYFSDRSLDIEGGNGTTRLHMDVSDAVNVMLWSSTEWVDGTEVVGTAAWDIFRAEDAGDLRNFLYRLCIGRDNGGNEAAMSLKEAELKYDDPIHAQTWYLNEGLRKRLFLETGIQSFRIWQRPGQAVLIPAGCAHQVCNFAACIKVASDFVSIANVGRCFDVASEFRLTHKSVIPWRDNILDLKSLLIWVWMFAESAGAGSLPSQQATS